MLVKIFVLIVATNLVSSALPPLCYFSEFYVTPYEATYDEARYMCKDYFGKDADLVQHTLGPEGSDKHTQIQSIAMGVDNDLYVGFDDRGTEGTWRFLDGEIFDTYNAGNVYQWEHGQPDDSMGEDCALIRPQDGGYAFNDSACEHEHHAICEIKTYYVCRD